MKRIYLTPLSKISRFYLKLFPTLLFLAIYCFGNTQDDHNKDVLILKNKTKLIGTLVEYNFNDSIVILIRGKRFTFPSKQVKKVIMHDQGVLAPQMKNAKFYHRLNYGFLANISGVGMFLNYSFMYQFNTYIGLGIGTGIDNYFFSPLFNSFPLFLSTRIYMYDARSSPYFKLNWGYSFAHKSRNLHYAAGGFLFNPSFGFRIGNNGVFTDYYIGFRMQPAEYKFYRGSVYHEQILKMKRIEIGMGINF